MFPPHAVFLGVLGASGLSKLSQVSKSLQGAEHWVEDGWGGLEAPLDSGRWGFEFWLFTLSDLGEI